MKIIIQDLKDYEFPLEEFTSPNGIKMVKGPTYSWRKDPIYWGQDEPWVLRIGMGTMSNCYNASYYINDPDKKLIISNVAYSSDESLAFKCSNIFVAELIVEAFMEANNFEISPLHDKKNQP